MRRIWFAAAGGVAVIALLGFAGISVTQTVEACVARGRAVLAVADPLDRTPPVLVADVVDMHVPRARLPGILSVVLLDRLSCRGDGAGVDWMIERRALAWRIKRTFSPREVVGLTASTMDTNTGTGALGLNAGARRFYTRSIDELGVEDVKCLVRKAFGVPRAYGVCGNEGVNLPRRY